MYFGWNPTELTLEAVALVWNLIRSPGFASKQDTIETIHFGSLRPRFQPSKKETKKKTRTSTVPRHSCHLLSPAAHERNIISPPPPKTAVTDAIVSRPSAGVRRTPHSETPSGEVQTENASTKNDAHQQIPHGDPTGRDRCDQAGSSHEFTHWSSFDVT